METNVLGVVRGYSKKPVTTDAAQLTVVYDFVITRREKSSPRVRLFLAGRKRKEKGEQGE